MKNSKNNNIILGFSLMYLVVVYLKNKTIVPYLDKRIKITSVASN
jgi:hypothetical protein